MSNDTKLGIESSVQNLCYFKQYFACVIFQMEIIVTRCNVMLAKYAV